MSMYEITFFYTPITVILEGFDGAFKNVLINAMLILTKNYEKSFK